MASVVSLAEAVDDARARRRHRRPRGVHPPHPPRRRSRADPPGPARPDAGADDARHRVRPVDRRRLRPQADLLVGRQPRRRIAAPLPRRRRERRGRGRSRSRSTATPGCRCATSPARRDCRSACCAATSAPTCPSTPTTIAPIACPFTGEELTAVPALNPDVSIIHAQQADRSGNVQLWGIVGVQKEACSPPTGRSSPSRRSSTSSRRGPGGVVLPALDGRRRVRGARRRPPELRDGLLGPRQRLLPGVGRHRPRSRHVHRLDRPAHRARPPTSPSTAARWVSTTRHRNHDRNH